MTDAELLTAIDALRTKMVSVATGGARIEDATPEFSRTYISVAAELARRGIENPLPYADLWAWYGRWSSGDMPKYQHRRMFVAEIVNPLLEQIQAKRTPEFEPTGWAKVDRQVGELRSRLSSSGSEEQFQAIGLLCREALISAAQSVYVRERHPSLDGVIPSETDAKRQLDAYIAVEYAGGPNDEIRKHMRSALDLSVNLQHKRTASFREAAVCAEATISVINILAITSGRRGPLA